MNNPHIFDIVNTFFTAIILMSILTNNLRKLKVMNNYIYDNQNTKSFYNMAWIAFVISFVGMVAGLFYMEADLAMKGFLGMSYLFSVTSCLTLSKVVRDKHEAEKFINKVENAKTEKFLNETNTTLSNS